MRLSKIIKRFIAVEKNRDKITLGTNVRLNGVESIIQLEEDGSDLYPTASDLYAKTWAANPHNVRQWLNFEVFVEHAYDDLNAPLTSLAFRLGDGTDEYWWDGGAWVVNTADWNTEAEVANNITSFPAVARKLEIVINLKTSDETVTPKVQEIRVLYSSDIEFREDLIARSMIPMLREKIRPISDFPVTLEADADTINLESDHVLETPYNVVGIDSVFQHTDDPEHWTDIYQSFNPSTQEITLDQTVPAGKVVWIKFIYEPEVSLATSQEFTEIAKVPSLVLSDITLTNTNRVGQSTGVVNKDAGTGVKIKGPRQVDVEITLRGHTDSARDHERLADELRSFFINNTLLTSKGLDEEYTLLLTSEYANRSVPGQTGIHSGLLRFRIVKALFYQEQEENVYAVQNLKLGGDMDVTI